MTLDPRRWPAAAQHAGLIAGAGFFLLLGMYCRSAAWCGVTFGGFLAVFIGWLLWMKRVSGR